MFMSRRSVNNPPGPLLIADPEVVSLIPAWPHTLVEIDHGIFSTVFLLLPLIQERLLSVQLKVCALSSG